jgi:hypothetical protein
VSPGSAKALGGMNGRPETQTPGGNLASAEETTESNAIVAQAADDCKALANLRASYALAGHSVHLLADGGFLVCKFNLAKHCPDLRALAAFAKVVGVRP